MSMLYNSVVLWVHVGDAVEESQIFKLMPHIKKILQNNELEYENGVFCITIYFNHNESN